MAQDQSITALRNRYGKERAAPTVLRCRECERVISPDARICPRCGIDHPGSAESPASLYTGIGIFVTFIACFSIGAWWWLGSIPETLPEGTMMGVSVVATAIAVPSLVILLNRSWSMEKRLVAALALLLSGFALFGAERYMSFEATRGEVSERELAEAQAALLASERALAEGDHESLIELLSVIPQRDREAFPERYARLQESADAFRLNQTLETISMDGNTDVLQKLTRVQSEWQLFTRQRHPPPTLRQIFENSVLKLISLIPESDVEATRTGYTTLELIVPDNTAYSEMLASLPPIPDASGANAAPGLEDSIPADAILPEPEQGFSLRGTLEDADPLAGPGSETGSATAPADGIAPPAE